MSRFEFWNHQFRNQNLYLFNNNSEGLIWLKVRALCRRGKIDEFLSANSITLGSSKIAEQYVELFELLKDNPEAIDLLNDFLSRKNNELYDALGIDTEKLKDDLFKVKHYSWGGDQNNSLDRHLVSRYVKVIYEYDRLLACQPDIAENAWNYVQTSWYNNWTSYLIESLFKRHPRVISAIGEIKSVDFFIDGYPLDLKVTYFPSQFLASKIKAALGHPELSWLKRQAKEHDIFVNNSLPDQLQIDILREKLAVDGHSDILDNIDEIKRTIISDSQSSPKELIHWLYSNQGETRFGAENRIFLILADTNDLSQSWKMKRAFQKIETVISSYLDNFSETSLKPIEFTYKGSSYKSLADAIFIVKE